MRESMCMMSVENVVYMYDVKCVYVCVIILVHGIVSYLM